MVSQTNFTVRTASGPVHLTISPVNEHLPNGDYYSTGVYKLHDGVVGMGDIRFDDAMESWTYNGLDELTYEEAAEVARFIQNYKDPAGADPDQLQ